MTTEHGLLRIEPEPISEEQEDTDRALGWGTLLSYENEKYVVRIRVFRDNWKGSEECFSFSGTVEQKVTGKRYDVRQRKRPEFFADDLGIRLRALQ
jgi:hypothetical protein